MSVSNTIDLIGNLKSSMRTIFRISILALLYGITGRLAFALAIPSGFATPVWPAAGIALAFVLLWGNRVLPGIFFGSFITNFILAFENGSELFSSLSLSVAGGVGFGAMVQAAVAAYCLKKLVVFPTNLSREKDVLLIFFIGGALCCMVNAIWSPIILALVGFISYKELIINMFTWWVGDTIGVVLFAPVVLLLFSRDISVLRKTIVTLPIFLVTTLTIFLFFNAKQLQQRDVQLQFDKEAAEVVNELEKSLHNYLNVLTAHERFVSASNYISFDEFQMFSSKFLQLFPNILALSWNPAVQGEDQDSFVQSIRDQGFADYEIKQRVQEEVVPVTEDRDLYFPVAYVVPYELNKDAHGYDTYSPDETSNNVRISVLDRAKQTGKAHSTGSLSVVQAQDQKGLLIYHPVYKYSNEKRTSFNGSKELKGYIAGVFMVNDILEPIAQDARNRGIDLVIKEELVSSHAQKEKGLSLLYTSNDNALVSDTQNRKTSYHKVVRVAEQNWHIYAYPNEDGLVGQSNWSLWYLLVGGLFFVSVFGGVLLIVSMKTEGINAQIQAHEMFERQDVSSDRMYVIPVITTVLVLLLTFSLYLQLAHQQKTYVNDTLEQRYKLIKHSIMDNVSDAVIALRRMAQRWEDRNQTPEEEWRADAAHYTEDYRSLKAVEWIDNTYHVRWVQPVLGNEEVVGMNIAFDKEREIALAGAARQNAITLTPPINLVQGYLGMVTYVPLHVDEAFKGFIAGVFDIRELMAEILQESLDGSFYVSIYDGNDLLYSNAGDRSVHFSDYSFVQYVSVFNRSWKVVLWGDQDTQQQEFSLLPKIVLMGGVLVSFLIGVVIYFSLISRRQSMLLNNKAVLLEENEKKYRSLTEQTQLVLDSAGEGVCGVDREGYTTFANQAAEEILGYQFDEMKDIMLHDLIHYAYPDGSIYPLKDCCIYETMKDGAPHTEDKEVFWHKSGKPIPVEYTSTPIYDSDGYISGAVVVFRDISERQKIEQEREAYTKELEEAKERATDANRAKSDFLAGMSHEIRTPMNGVLGTVELLNETKLSQKQRKYVDIIRNSGKSLLEIINEILDYSKIEAGKFDLYEDAYDFEKAIEEQVMLLQPLAHERSLFYKWSFDSNLPRYVYGDSVRTSQVLTNFISNAIKFTPSGGVTITVLEDPDREGFVLFSVKDTGIGIPQKSLTKVFGAFEQVMEGRKAAKTAGTGLGLAISQHLVELMGGEIGLESKEGEGSTFWFSLPIKIPTQEQMDGLRASEQQIDNQERFKASILVVEDVITNQFVIKTMLNNMGCEVDLANNGIEAIEAIGKKDYDLVFMDCNMPLMDGFEATQKLREAGYDDLKIVALTANAIEGDRERCLDAGMNDFVTKPVEKSVVVEALLKWLPDDKKL